MKDGEGVLTFANGDKYDGEFIDDEFEGQGVFTWANGDKYEGQFKNGKAEG